MLNPDRAKGNAPAAVTVEASVRPQVQTGKESPMNGSTGLRFQETAFHVIDRNGQPWLRATEIAEALGYSRSDKVSETYNRNSDEFTDAMTLTINMRVKGFGGGYSEKPVRIFSLRGAHLLAMLARTPKAKEFRRWVLDILDRETAVPPAPTFQEHIARCMDMAVAVTDKARREIFTSLVKHGAGDSEITRYMVCLDHEMRPSVYVVESGAVVASLPRLAEMLLEDCGIYPSDEELARLAQACTQRLVNRYQSRARVARK